MPQSLKDHFSDKFSRFERDSKMVVDYQSHYHELDKHATSIF